MKALKSDLRVHMRSSNLERGLISPVTGLPGEHRCWDIFWSCLPMAAVCLYSISSGGGDFTTFILQL